MALKHLQEPKDIKIKYYDTNQFFCVGHTLPCCLLSSLCLVRLSAQNLVFIFFFILLVRPYIAGSYVVILTAIYLEWKGERVA